MSPTAEKQILEKLKRIEDLLIRVVPARTDLREEDVLKIIKEGRAAQEAGTSREFDDFVAKDYPHLVKGK